jgi:hypothetical protein
VHKLALFLAAVLIGGLVAAGPLSESQAAVTASPVYSASTRVAGTPNHTITYAITITRTGVFSRLVLPLPASASKSGLSIGTSNIRAGVLESVRGGFVFRTATPYQIAAGTRLWVMINGIQTPPPSAPAVTITAYTTANGIMARGTTPAVPFTAPKPCPAAWPQGYVATENALPGTTSWRLTATAYSTTAAAGFASHTSARCGDTVTFRVQSNEYRLAVSIYRMGYYNGTGARAVWHSRSAVRGFAQPAMQMVKLDSTGREINMATGRNWIRTFSVRIDGSFPPGDYLAKVTGAASQKGAYIPLIVRDDTGSHDKLVLNSVATWQAYNSFGGVSAYTSPVVSKRISYDRPLLRNQGTGDFLSLEYGLVYWAEKQGIDLNYAADTDLHSRPYLYDHSRTLVLMPHTEYWSTRMRTTVDTAVAGGKHLASFGGNQIYWRINPMSSTLTGADREYEIFRTGDTSRFRDPPSPNPEQNLLGAMFGCMHMDGTAQPNDTWLWQNVTKQPIAHLAQGEVDSVQTEFAIPQGLQVLTTIPVDACNRTDDLKADIVAVDDGSGGRVFNASTHSWACMLYGFCPWPGWTPTSTAQTQLGQATMNVFTWLDAGTVTSPLTESAKTARLSRFQSQTEGVLKPISGMPPLEPNREAELPR